MVDVPALFMVWKGVEGDQGIYFSPKPSPDDDDDYEGRGLAPGTLPKAARPRKPLI
jgi:hypothetical protein